jgi:GGDEF domain-containing protein
MRSLHFWIIILSSWLFLLFNAERFSPALDLAGFVYLLAIICAIETIVLLSWVDLPLVAPFVLMLPFYLVLKVALDGPIFQINLPLTVVEIMALGGTVFVTGEVTRRLNALESALQKLLLGHVGQDVEPFETGQGHIYREIRRARHYQRPATLLAISIADNTLEQSFDRFLAELQQETTKKYMRARVADFLKRELRDCDVVARRDHHFVALLPETGRQNVEPVLKRLERAAAEQLGLNIQVGVATFPDEAVTFETLLERAEAKMAGWLDEPGRESTLEARPGARLSRRSPLVTEEVQANGQAERSNSASEVGIE